MNETFILSLISLIVAVLGLSLQHFLIIGNIKERLAALETKTEVFWRMAEKQMAKMLKQPTHRRKDDLLDKIIDDVPLTFEEAVELRTILRNEIDGARELKLTYTFMLGRLEIIIQDLQKRMCKRPMPKFEE